MDEKDYTVKGGEMKVIKWILIIWSALGIITIPTNNMHYIGAFFAFIFFCLVIITSALDLANMDKDRKQRELEKEVRNDR